MGELVRRCRKSCIERLILAVVLAGALPQVSQTQTQPEDQSPRILSPRLLQLQADLTAGVAGSEDGFWSSVKGHSPLLELIPPRNEGAGYVTFLWRGDDGTVEVNLNANLPPLPNRHYDEGKHPLAQLGRSHLWYRTERLPFDTRMSYDFTVTERAASGETSKSDHADPFNSETSNDASIFSNYFAPKEPWLQRMSGVAAGTTHPHSLFSHILGEERTFSVYIPAGGARLGSFAIILDGERYTARVPGPIILDNLIAKGMMDSTVVVFVNSRGYDRQVDFACNRRFADFLATELVPWVRKMYGVASTAVRSLVGGSSLGGLQSACTAYWHPESFQNVLSMSGSFAWYPESPSIEQDSVAGLKISTGWLTQKIAASPKRPIRFFVTTETFEGDGVIENRRFRDVLTAKGYPLIYKEFSGGHDDAVWRDILPEGLIALLPPRR